MYEPLVIREGYLRHFFSVFVFYASLAILGVSIWGLADKATVGLGLEVSNLAMDDCAALSILNHF